MVKKILKISGVSLLVLVALAFLIPIVFKKQILQLVKSEINKSINAKIAFKDVTLSLFKHFPKASISIEDLSVIGVNEFASDTLVSATSIDATANLWSVIRGNDIKLYGVYLNSPRIHAFVNKAGKANWDIAKSANDILTDTSASNFKLNLKKYEINNGYLQYRDESSGINTEIIDFDHEGKGDFTQDVFTLTTNTNAAQANFIYAGIPYLINTKTDIGADIKIDNKSSTYTFATDDIQLNNLKLSLNGYVQLVNDSMYDMDLKFKTPANNFKDILSLIPAIYKKDFDKLKTEGKASVEGFVKGMYSPSTLPAYNVHAEIKDGFFQYPDLPKELKNIQLSLDMNNPDGNTDHTVINIPSGHFEMDNEPFDFRFLLKNPETVKFIDAAAKGKLDLSKFSKLIKLDNGTKLYGLVWADVFARGNLSAIENHSGPFVAGGILDIQKLFYSSKDFPQPIQNGNIKIQLENNEGIADKTYVNIPAGHVEVGEDPIDFSLAVRNPVSTCDFAGNVKGKFNLKNLKQFVPLDSGTFVNGLMNADLNFSGYKAAIEKSEYDKINTTGTVDFKNVKYTSKDYPTGINIAKSTLTFNQNNIVLNNLSGSYLNTNFTADGILNNLIGYALQNQTLEGTMNVTADKMNLNKWMGDDTTATSTAGSSDPFAVPANIDFLVNAKVDKLKYDKVDYKNINGSLLLNNETVKLQNVSTEALDGQINFNGSYSTRVNKKQPDIALSYDVKDVDVQKAFYAYNTMQKLMPIGQFLAGKLSSQLTMTGKLDGNMMPDFNSLSGNGNLLLIQGVLKKFAPVEKLANELQISELKEVSVKDIKNYIEFANGKVLVKPFPLKVKDIEMVIGGTHGFDQSLDYLIQMRLPRKYLGSRGNDLVNGLVTQASNKGVPVTVGDIVNLKINMRGSMTDPTIKTDLKEVAGDATADLKQQAVDFANAKVDSTRTAVKDTLSSVKKQVVENVKQDLVKNLLPTKDSSGSKPNLDSTKKKTEAILKSGLNGLMKKKKKS